MKNYKNTLSSPSGNPVYFSFPGRIWKLLPDASSMRLVLECRDENQRKTTFTCLDAVSGKTVWQELKISEDWWVGMNAVQDGKVFLHGYKSNSNPEHLGIWVADIKSGKILWHDTQFTMVPSAAKEGLLVYKEENGERKYYLTETNSGKIQKEIPEKEILKMMKPGGVKDTSTKFPYHFHQENKFFPDIKDFIQENFQEEAVEGLDYLELERNVLISYYVKGNDSLLINRLVVLNQNGDVLLKENLTEEAKGITTDSFFVKENRLIYVINKNKLAIYEL